MIISSIGNETKHCLNKIQHKYRILWPNFNFQSTPVFIFLKIKWVKFSWFLYVQRSFTFWKSIVQASIKNSVQNCRNEIFLWQFSVCEVSTCLPVYQLYSVGNFLLFALPGTNQFWHTACSVFFKQCDSFYFVKTSFSQTSKGLSEWLSQQHPIRPIHPICIG